MHTCAVVMAAGKAVAMRSKHAKEMLPVAGKPLICWVRDALNRAGARDQVYIVGHWQEQLRSILGEQVAYVLQENPQGTGHAVLQASSFLEGRTGATFVVGSDAPLIRPETLKAAQERFIKQPCAVVVVTAQAEDPTGYGRILRNSQGQVFAVVEEQEADEHEALIREVNSGVYFFDTALLLSALGRIKACHAGQEKYLTDTLRVLADLGHRIETYSVSFDEIRGVNDRFELQQAEASLYRRQVHHFMRQGVSIIDPNRTLIEDEVQIEPDVTIHPGCHLKGRTVIGEGSVLGPNCDLTDCQIGREVRLHQVHAESARIGDRARLGPYTQLKPGCVIGSQSVIESFVTLRQTVLGPECRVRSHSEIERALIGERVTVGSHCAMTTDPDQTNDPVSIGSHAVIESHCCLNAPLRIGEHARIAAGTIVTESVPAYARAAGRCRQTNEEDWDLRRRRLQKE